MFDTDQIARATVQHLINHVSYIFLRASWSGMEPGQAVAIQQWLETSPILEEIRLLGRVANGEVAHNAMTVGEVLETIQDVVELLFSVPGSNTYDIPGHFWSSSLGSVIRYCQVWAQGDDLINHSEAAQILFDASDERELMRIRRLIENGNLDAYEDPRESNPRHAQRVLRSQVEALKQ